MLFAAVRGCSYIITLWEPFLFLVWFFFWFFLFFFWCGFFWCDFFLVWGNFLCFFVCVFFLVWRFFWSVFLLVFFLVWGFLFCQTSPSHMCPQMTQTVLIWRTLLSSPSSKLRSFTGTCPARSSRWSWSPRPLPPTPSSSLRTNQNLPFTGQLAIILQSCNLADLTGREQTAPSPTAAQVGEHIWG